MAVLSRLILLATVLLLLRGMLYVDRVAVMWNTATHYRSVGIVTGGGVFTIGSWSIGPAVANQERNVRFAHTSERHELPWYGMWPGFGITESDPNPGSYRAITFPHWLLIIVASIWPALLMLLARTDVVAVNAITDASPAAMICAPTPERCPECGLEPQPVLSLSKG